MSTASRIRKYWTDDEDQILRREANFQLSQGALKNWNDIAAKLPGRTNKDCRKRWSKVGGNVNRGSWTAEEDNRLRDAVNQHSYCWTVVARFVDTRHADQCAKRWYHFLDPNLSHKEWDSEEDDRLFAAVRLRGRSWTLIGQEEFPYRSATDIKNRYVVLERKRQHGLVMPKSSDTGLSNSNTATGDVAGIDLQGLAEASEISVSGPELIQMEDIDTSLATPSNGPLLDDNMVSALYPDHGSASSSMNPSLSIPSPFADLTSTNHFSNVISSRHQEPATANVLSWDENSMDMNLFSLEQLNTQEDFSDFSCVYSDVPFLLDSSGSNKDQKKPDEESIHRNTLILKDVQPDVLSGIMDVLFRCRANVKMNLVSGDV